MFSRLDGEPDLFQNKVLFTRSMPAGWNVLRDRVTIHQRDPWLIVQLDVDLSIPAVRGMGPRNCQLTAEIVGVGRMGGGLRMAKLSAAERTMKELCLMSKHASGIPSGGLDRLYPVALGGVRARNELAKSAGAGAASIRALEKPNIPAWAVNQLYWRERRVYDALVKASERLRAAHAQALAGKKIDLPLLELQHSAALKTAADAIRRQLRSAGDAGTPPTIKAVIDTRCEAASGSQPGRLNRKRCNRSDLARSAR